MAPIAEQKPVAHTAEQKLSLVPEQPIKPQNKAPDVINYNKENICEYQSPAVTSDDVKIFLQKRFPFYNTALEETQSQDNDSGKHTSSSKWLFTIYDILLNNFNTNILRTDTSLFTGWHEETGGILLIMVFKLDNFFNWGVIS